jgi:hypothetical protein
MPRTDAELTAAKLAFIKAWPAFRSWLTSGPDPLVVSGNYDTVPDEPFAAALGAADALASPYVPGSIGGGEWPAGKIDLHPEIRRDDDPIANDARSVARRMEYEAGCCFLDGDEVRKLLREGAAALTAAKAMADAVEQALKPWDRSPPHTPAWVLELRAALDAWDKVGK